MNRLDMDAPAMAELLKASPRAVYKWLSGEGIPKHATRVGILKILEDTDRKGAE